MCLRGKFPPKIAFLNLEGGKSSPRIVASGEKIFMRVLEVGRAEMSGAGRLAGEKRPKSACLAG